MTRFMPRTDKGAFAAMVRAMPFTVSARSALATTRWASPMRSASAAFIGSPNSSIMRASDSPIRLMSFAMRS